MNYPFFLSSAYHLVAQGLVKHFFSFRFLSFSHFHSLTEKCRLLSFFTIRILVKYLTTRLFCAYFRTNVNIVTNLRILYFPHSQALLSKRAMTFYFNSMS